MPATPAVPAHKAAPAAKPKASTAHKAIPATSAVPAHKAAPAAKPKASTAHKAASAKRTVRVHKAVVPAKSTHAVKARTTKGVTEAHKTKAVSQHGKRHTAALSRGTKKHAASAKPVAVARGKTEAKSSPTKASAPQKHAAAGKPQQR